MSDYTEQTSEEAPAADRKLKKEKDFRAEVESRGAEQLRQDLGLPNVDEILKDLQRKHGIRIALSPKMIARFEAIKEKAELTKEFPALRDGCISTDTCILCDHGDLCQTCDVSDWCIWSDNHVIEA
jgi:hypothetical protein